MDEKSITNLLSSLLPAEGDAEPDDANDEARRDGLLEALNLFAGQSGGALEQEVGSFLEGRGELLEATRASVQRGRSSAVSEVADFLERSFHLSAPVARIVASLAVKLFPSIGKIAGGASTAGEKPKPRRRRTESSQHDKPASGSKPKKPKPSASAKPASSKPKHPKTSSSAKPSSSDKPKKPKTSSSSKPATHSKPRKTTRSGAEE